MRYMDSPEIRFEAYTYDQIESFVTQRQTELNDTYGAEPIYDFRPETFAQDEAAELMRVYLLRHPETNPHILMVVFLTWTDDSSWEPTIITLDTLPLFAFLRTEMI